MIRAQLGMLIVIEFTNTLRWDEDNYDKRKAGYQYQTPKKLRHGQLVMVIEGQWQNINITFVHVCS